MGQHSVHTVVHTVNEWLCTLPFNEAVRVKSGMEQEAKFFEFNLEHVVRMLEQQGAKPQPTTLLTTIRYDTPDRLLNAHDHVVRLRLYNRNFDEAEVTYKGPKMKHPGGLKVRQESSRSPVSFMSISRFLINQGLEATTCVEKLRTDFILPGAAFSIDEFPNGSSLLEIEAKEERTIYELCGLLNLKIDKKVSGVGERKALRYLYGSQSVPSQIMFPPEYQIEKLEIRKSKLETNSKYETRKSKPALERS